MCVYVIGFALTEYLCVQNVCNSCAYLSISTAMFKHCSPTCVSLQEHVLFNDPFTLVWESGYGHLKPAFHSLYFGPEVSFVGHFDFSIHV